jgi:hypothetical protein
LREICGRSAEAIDTLYVRVRVRNCQQLRRRVLTNRRALVLWILKWWTYGPTRSRRSLAQRRCGVLAGQGTGVSSSLLTTAQHRLMLFDVKTQKRTELTKFAAGWQAWSRGGDYIYFLDSSAGGNGHIPCPDQRSQVGAGDKPERFSPGSWLGKLDRPRPRRFSAPPA